MRSVTPGVTNGGVTQVEGINPGDVVADSSFDKLQDNAKVVVSNTPPSNTPASNAPAPKKPAGGKKTGSGAR